MPVDGIGEGSSECTQQARVPIMLDDGPASYSAPMIDGSSVPALLGTTTMTDHRFLIDLVHDRCIMLGPGGMQLQLSPGSRVLPLLRSETGHLMIPVSEWAKHKNKPAASSAPAIALPVL